ncbi:MAG: pantoate--beta-alanine ligase [Firmicutes bacterium]|nr:pantoate--beta-alanine ligase [Bacillota bacterium]
MLLVTEIASLKNIIKAKKQKGLTIGLVPTMGFLHEGHLSLMRAAAAENDFVVGSIFVNPLQFGIGEDYEEYPRDLENDTKLAKSAGCDLIFSPTVKEMYPSGYATFIQVERLTEGLCGASRPGHFVGVTTVVAKLFNLVRPNRAYFGQKDAQQAFVLIKMVEDLNMNLDIVVLPTVREPDGLALSSRNKYLTPGQRKEAAVIYKSLKEAESQIKKGERKTKAIRENITKSILLAKHAEVDYVEIVDCQDLSPISTINKGRCLIAVAAKFGKTRLIDNILVEV